MPQTKRTTVTKAKKSPARTKAAASPKKAKTPPPKKAPAKKLAVAKKAAPAARAAKKSVASLPGLAPTARRAIFIDVENTSNEAALTRVIENLKIDRAAQPTEFYAVGNWRAVGQTMSRHLARLGASLVHSAPVTGVRDWSDLWIAVAAGRWIAMAKPGDSLEIVSDDKAFEAVGDAAATAGVIFRRVLHRSGSARTASAAASTAAAEPTSDGAPRRRRRRGGRGRRRGPGNGGTSAATAERPAPARETAARQEPAPKPEPRRRQESPRRQPRRQEAPKPPAAPKAEAAPADTDEAANHSDSHGASLDQVLATIRRLTNNDPNRWVNLDLVSTALKSEGYTRPPGSPRLVVRLRRMKGVEVQPNGMVRIIN